MVKTAVERKRLQRERDREQREKMRHILRDSTYPYLKRTFSDLANEEGGFSDIEIPLLVAGIQPPTFFDERGPEECALDGVTDGVDNPYLGAEGAIGRAEVIVDCLLDAALELSGIVNSYKRQELEARLRELESSDTTDRATAMKDAVKLNKILDQLNKKVRRSFPEWKVTGS
ncbi:hypothetical protein OAN307_c10790 [Octadecabacter antarcticus 307]|uniref:Uncharacterized protein n=1 Tax=Octadecabacter antarcticus 307 TaxID=391626 RepID=M9R2A4_9RHOB|nr:hypothetical protein [Octadecabacter antarcticus]AGI66784.1 hypothetical protein OAN307_c10790 [Octadecabacter antarcticus 307]